MTDDPSNTGDALKRVPFLHPGDVDRGILLPGMDTGVKEAKLLGADLSQEEIASRQANREHWRNEKFRDHFERAALCGLWLFAVCILFAGATWFYHVVTPDSWHWLSADGTTRLQNILTGGVVAAVAGGHLKRRMG